MNNKKTVLAKQAQYVSNNREKITRYKNNWQKEDRNNNPEKYADKKRAYQIANPEKLSEQYHRRRARKNQNGVFVVSTKEIKRIYASPCIYCGSTAGITLEHIIPISRGGRHSIGNLAPACSPCNTSKHNKLITEWKKFKSSH